MSETLSWQFIGYRLYSVQNDVADVRRRMIAMVDRFGGIEDRIGGVENRIGVLERRSATLETRIDALVERVSALEGVAHRSLHLLERIAAKVGIEDG